MKLKKNKTVKLNGLGKEELRKHLEEMFPPTKPLISRHDATLNSIVAWGTLANKDSEKIGIAKRIIIAGKTFYERNSTIYWLVDRAE